MFKSNRPYRLITIIFWVILIFIAIIKLPSATRLATNLNDQIKAPSQISQSRQLTRADHLQNNWGRRLDYTQTVDLVYNRKRGTITNHQQRQINHSVDKLQKHASRLGISKITDLNTNRSGSDELKSPDNSTEIIQLNANLDHLKRSTGSWSNIIKKITQISSLRNSVTNPQLLKDTSTRSTAHLTIVITIVGLLLSSLVIGLLFKSLIAPVISFISLLITDLISLSITENLAAWTGFNEFTPLAITTTVLIIGSIMTYYICQAIIVELPRHRDPNHSVQQGLSHVKRPLELSGLTLTLAFGAAIFIPQIIVKSIANLGITFAVLTLTELTIIPIFISWLGKDIQWPSRQYQSPQGHKLWNRLARLSLWQPMIGIIAIIYFVVPFAYSYRNNVNYSQINNLPTNRQAYRGVSELNAHFTAGKATPVNIYIHSPRKFNREATLKPLDDLTTKLQSIPDVNAVYSITQPSGMPINKYYVNHQLSVINKNLDLNLNHLHHTEQLLKRGQKNSSRHQLAQIQNQLNHLSQIQINPQANVNPQANSINGKQKADLANKISQYQGELQALSNKLQQAANQFKAVNNIKGKVKNYQNRIKMGDQDIKKASRVTQRVNHNLNNIYTYLSDLQQSSATHQYFITPDQIQDTDFQQSLFNFTSQNEKTTKLQVVFNQAPNIRYNEFRLKRLKNETKTELQGTPLKHANVALSGEPVQQATIHKNFKSGIIKVLLIISGILLLSLILISRSIINPIVWLTGLTISSLAGAQITELIIRYTTNQPQINWELLLTVMGIITGFAAFELIPLSLAYRHRKVNLIEWLHETFTGRGQTIPAIILIITLSTLALFAGISYETAQLSLIIIITSIIFNCVLPLLTSAIDKYTKELPHSKL